MIATQQQSLQTKFVAKILQGGKDRKFTLFYKNEETIEQITLACKIMAWD
jgi:hypothetical protein